MSVNLKKDGNEITASCGMITFIANTDSLENLIVKYPDGTTDLMGYDDMSDLNDCMTKLAGALAAEKLMQTLFSDDEDSEEEEDQDTA